MPGAGRACTTRSAARVKLAAMKQILTALSAAIEAGAVALLGMLFFAIPTLLFWFTNSNPESTISVLPVVALSAWLLGHTVPLEFPLSADAAFDIGVVTPALHIPISLPLLGALCVTLWFAFRQGRKYATLFITDTSSAAAFGKTVTAEIQWLSLVAVLAGAAIGFGAVVLIAAASIPVASAVPLWWQVLKPTLWFAAAVLVGIVWVGRQHLAALSAARLFPGDVPLTPAQQLLRAVRVAPRIALAQLAGWVAVAAIAVTCAAIFNYVDFVRVSETLQADALGLIILFLVQLLLLPVAIIWALAWLSGAGFSVGAETLYSPFVTITTELPALPFFTLLPHSNSTAGVIAPLLLLVIAVVLGYCVGSWLTQHTDLERFYALTAAGVLTGIAAGFAVSVAVGSVGPGRLSYTGAEPLLVGFTLAGLSTLGLNAGAFLRSAAPQLAQVGATAHSLRDKTKLGMRRASAASAANSVAAESMVTSGPQLPHATLMAQAETIEQGAANAVVRDAETGHFNTADLTEFEPLSAGIAESDPIEDQYDTEMLLRNFEWQAKPVQLGKHESQTKND